MSQVQRTASVHPGTVTEYSRGEHRRGRRKELSDRRPYSTRAQSTQVHAEVWAIAVDSCGGDKRRIEVLSPTEVYIHNDPNWKSYR